MEEKDEKGLEEASLPQKTPRLPQESSASFVASLGAATGFFPVLLVLSEPYFYGLNCVPPNTYVEALTPSTSECDYIER